MSASMVLNWSVKSRETGSGSGLSVMTFVRQDEFVVLSLEGSGDASSTGMSEASRLLAPDSFSDSKLAFGVTMFGECIEVEIVSC